MRGSAVVSLVVAALLVTGCAAGSGAPPSTPPAALTSPAAPTHAAAARTATPRPTATPTPRPTPTATAAPTSKPSAKPSSSADPIAGLRIAAPYGLQHLDPIMNAAYEAAMSKALGSLGSTVRIGIRQAAKSGSPAGFVMVLVFVDPSVAQMTGFLDAVAGGSASSLGGKLGKKTIAGRPVRYASSAQGAFAAYLRGESVVYVITSTTKSALDVVTAVIKANR